MADNERVLGYTLTPVKSGGNGFGTAALMSCMVTGKTIKSSGGGNRAISMEVIQLLEEDNEIRQLIASKLGASIPTHSLEG